MRNYWRIVAAAAALLALPALAAGPGSGRPIRIVVPVAPGGPSDTAVRLLAPRLAETFGQALVIDNRPSNNGIAGTEIAARANPDGLTFNVGNSGTHAINASLYKKLPYDPQRDFVPISRIVTSGMIVAVNPKVPATTLAEFANLARKQPGRTNVGVAGATGELAGDALWHQLQMKMNNINYKGSSPAEFALLSGEVDVVLLTPLASMNHINSGRLRALAITSSQRTPLLPTVATVAELGVAGYDFQIWHGLFAPVKTPPAVLRTAYKGVTQALAAPEIRERFTSLGFVVIGSTSEEFAAFIATEIDKFRRIVATSGIAVQ